MAWLGSALGNAAMYIVLGAFVFTVGAAWVPVYDAPIDFLRRAWTGAGAGAVVGLIDGFDTYKRNHPELPR